MKTVSVVIPCYNVGEYLADCLDSVTGQTHRPLEIICVDDCSSDSTLEILQGYRAKYPALLMVLQNSTNRGASFTRNRGLQAAKGEYIQYLDADDMLLPDKLLHQVTLLEGESRPVLLAGSCLRQRTNGATTKHFAKKVDPWEGLIKSELGNTCANLWPREALLEVNGWDDSLGSSQEYNLMFRLLKRNVGVLFDHECLTIVRERVSGSITKKDPPANWRRFLDLRLQILDYVHNNCPSEAIERVALQTICEVLHILYEYDRETAKELYARHVHGRYLPHASPYLTKKIVIAYRLLGFALAERLSLRNIRSAIVSAVNLKSNNVER